MDVQATRGRRRDRRVMFFVFVALFCAYVVVQRGEFVSWDGRVVAGVARNIWQHGSLHKFGDSFGGDPGFRSESPYSVYGIGMSVLLAPLWGFQLHRDPNGAMWLTLLCPLLLATASSMLFLIGLELGWRRVTAVAVAFVFGAATMAMQYSTELFPEPAITLATVVVVLGLLRWRRGRRAGPWMIGAAIAGAIFVREDSALLLGAALLAAPLFVSMRELRATVVRWLPALALTIGPSVAWALKWNAIRSGSPFDSGYRGQTFSTPIAHGLHLIFVSAGKGFFWYNPVLLAALVGIPLLWRRQRGVAVVVVGLFLMRSLFYSAWWSPEGGVAWGPRFLLPAAALLVIPLGQLWEDSLRWPARSRVATRVATGALLAASAAVAFVSVWVPATYYQDEIGRQLSHTPNGGSPAWLATAHRLEHRAYYSVGWTPIVRNALHVTRSRPFPLMRFRGSASPEGIGSLCIAVLAIAFAFDTARRRDAVDTVRIPLAVPVEPVDVGGIPDVGAPLRVGADL